MIGRISEELYSKSKRRMLSGKGLLGCFLLPAAVAVAQPAIYGADAPLPIKRVSVNTEQQLVVEFGGSAGAFPSKPNLQDFPGTNHRLVLDFGDAAFDKEQIAPAKDTLTDLTKVYPAIKGLRYAALTNTTTPTARIVLDLPEALKANPHIVKLEAGSVTIDLGLEGGGAGDVTAKATPESQGNQGAAATDAAPTPVATSVSASPTALPTSGSTGESGRERIDATSVTPTVGSSTDETKGSASSVDSTETKPASTVSSVTETQTVDTGLQNKPAGAELTTSSTQTGASNTIQTTTVSGNPAASESGTTASTSSAQQPASDVSASKPADTSAAAAASSSEGSTTGEAKDATAKPADQVASVTPAVGVTAGTSEDTKHQYAEAVRHYNQGYELHKSQKLTAAIAEYQAAIAANPSLSQAYSNLGMIYNQQHNYKDALTEFRKALAIDPKDAITYNGIGAALRAQKDMLGAIKNWQTAVSIDPKLATAHYNLGTAYEIQKDYDKALDCYRQAVKNDYRLGEAYYRMGLILQKRNNLEEALEQFNKALKVSSKAEYSQDAHQRIAILNEKKTGKK